MNKMCHEEDPLAIRAAVSGSGQIQMPEWLLEKVGYVTESLQGEKPVVDWYVSDSRGQAVIGGETGQGIDDLEYIKTVEIGVSLEEYREGEYAGTRISVTKDLPEAIYNELTGRDIVVQPLYKEDLPIESTLALISGAKEYDTGDCSDHNIKVVENTGETGYRITRKNTLPKLSGQDRDPSGLQPQPGSGDDD